jgi:hypothetical protein
LYNSLKSYCKQFELYVLCLDNITLEYFLVNPDSFPEIKTISIEEIEESDKEFKECKTNRSKIEYYFTLSPCLPLYILKRYNISHICSLDADIKFFSSPEIVFSLLDKYSILITPHNFSPELKSLELYGRYNVSFQIFKNDKSGLDCLEKWRTQCIDWCYDRLENGKYADQKYLDAWVVDFNGVSQIDNIGVGVAPWNLNSYSITNREGQIFVNNTKLICYHFHGLRLIDKNLIIHGMDKYGVRISRAISRNIYKPYIDSLLSNNLFNDSEIERHIISPQTIRETILYQKTWYYYKSGILFKKNYFFDLFSRTINYFRNQILKWRN